MVNHKVPTKKHTNTTCEESKDNVDSTKSNTAEWDALNHDLQQINWDNLLDCTEPEVAWKNFNRVLFTQINQHIPTITVDARYQSPWFDCEVYEKYRIKERAHKNLRVKKV